MVLGSREREGRAKGKVSKRMRWNEERPRGERNEEGDDKDVNVEKADES